MTPRLNVPKLNLVEATQDLRVFAEILNAAARSGSQADGEAIPVTWLEWIAFRLDERVERLERLGSSIPDYA